MKKTTVSRPASKTEAHPRPAAPPASTTTTERAEGSQPIPKR